VRSETTNHELFLASFLVFLFSTHRPGNLKVSRVVSCIGTDMTRSKMGKEEIKYLPDTPVPLRKAIAEDMKEDCLPCRAIGISTSLVFHFSFPFSFLT